MLSQHAEDNLPDSQPTQSLLNALKNNKINLASILSWKKELDISACDENGKNALHLICENNSNASGTTTGKKERKVCLENILKAHANIDQKDNRGNTPLHTAVKNPSAIRMTFIKLLKEHGANLNATDNTGKTPLYLAIGTKHFDCVDYLIKHNATLDIKTKHGNSALHFALQRYSYLNEKDRHLYLDCAKKLIKQGADINLKDGSGDTPLIMAVNLKDVKLVKYLIEAGANLYDKDKNNLTAMDLITNAITEHHVKANDKKELAALNEIKKLFNKSISSNVTKSQKHSWSANRLFKKNTNEESVALLDESAHVEIYPDSDNDEKCKSETFTQNAIW